MAEFDHPWKEALEKAFDRCMAFLFPEIAAEVDWSIGYESLDTEIRKLLPEAAVGKRISDALVKAQTKERDDNGRDVRYIHIEVQCQVQADFPNRVDDYNHLYKVRYSHPILSAAILGDDHPDWRPNQYVYECAGFRKEVTYPIAKLLDYRGREAELEKHANPVALLVLAHLLALGTRRDNAERRAGKLRLLKIVMDRKMEAEDSALFARLIDWMVDLPAEGQRLLWEEVRRYATEKNMPFLSYPEQIGFDKGYDKGKEEGFDKGKVEGLLKGIELGLKLKFGAEGLQLLPAIQAQQDLALLQKIFNVIGPDATLDDVRRLLPSS